MKVLRPGHKYELEDFEDRGNNVPPQTLQFIEKDDRQVLNTATGVTEVQLVTVYDGTTNEEVLKVLIDRMQWLQAKAPCRENALVITKLEESLMWLEKRTADRKARGVEGTPAK